jgi:hypothetical protein
VIKGILDLVQLDGMNPGYLQPDFFLKPFILSFLYLRMFLLFDFFSPSG